MHTSFRAIDVAMTKGLLYLAEALQYYWPANRAEEKGEIKGYLNNFAENNIALHMARSFAEQGFLSWAEVPWKNTEEDKPHKRLDFLAYNYAHNVSIALEFKNSIWQPYKVRDDMHRLVSLRKQGIASETHGFNNAAVDAPDHKFYGIVVILEATEFADWWHYPANNNYIPQGKAGGDTITGKALQDSTRPRASKRAEDYAIIGKALNVATARYVVPLIEYFRENHSEDLRWRFQRGAYALYDENSMIELEKVLKV